jgi:MHS family proline/betaine transporter-like MFS transporter
MGVGVMAGGRVARTGRGGGGSRSRRALVAAVAGNAVEWYDLALYGAFATILAAVFFPGDDPARDLLATLGVFSGAFLFRPVGAVLLGRAGDRHGRRPALVAAVLLMSVATAGVGLLPGYRALGPLAPALLLLCRSLQGVSVGGEAGAASAFAVEHAPAGRRGFYGGLLWGTVALGLGAGVGAAALSTRMLPPGPLAAWGWRLPFLAALPLGLCGLYLRFRSDETPPFAGARASGSIAAHPVRETLRRFPGEVAIGAGLVAAASVTFNTFFVFLPNDLAGAGVLPLPRALSASLPGLLVFVLAAPVLGAWSDRVGRRPALIAATLGLLVLAGPAYLLIRRGGWGLYAYVPVGLVLGCFVLPAFLSELFPTPVRSTGLAVTYGLPAGLAGGTAPLLDGLLIRWTGNPIAPVFYVLLVSILALVCALAARETASGSIDARIRWSRPAARRR